MLGKGWLVLTALLLVVLTVGVACGDDEEKATLSPTAATASPSPSPGEAPAPPGDAGIRSNPRAINGFSVWKVDDGNAMFAERPAGEDRTGVTDTSVKICRPSALSGPFASFNEAMALQEELIGRVNAAGGVHGRSIELVSRDTKGDAPTAVQIVREFVESEKCFAIFGSVDAQIHESYFDYTVEHKVPMVFSVITNNFVGEPGDPYWVTGTSSTQEIQRIFGRYVFEKNPGIKIGILYENDTYGQGGLAGWEAAAKAAGGNIAVSIPFTPAAPDLNGQIQQIVQAGATGFVGLGYPTDWPKFITGLREVAGSNMPMFDPGGLSVFGVAQDPNLSKYIDGIISHTFGPLQPGDPEPGIIDSVAVIQEQEMFPIVFTVAFGQGLPEYLVRALECAGPDLTRQGFMAAINGGCFDGSYTCTVCAGPGIITPTDRWPQETIFMQQWDGANGVWKRISDPISLETSEGEGLRGNFDDLQCSDKLPCPWKEGCLPDAADRCAWAGYPDWTFSE